MTKPFAKVELSTSKAPRVRLSRWVSAYGASRLSRSLTTDRRTVHTWTQKVKPTMPSLRMIQQMIALSTIEPLADGPLSYEDFFGVVVVAEHTSHSYGRPPRKLANAPRTVLTRKVC